MNDFRESRLSKILETILLPISLAFIALFLYVAISRISYPFELNRLEGGVLNVVNRIMAGQSIYTEPSLQYVPFLNTPLYYLLSSLIANLAGPGFKALRLVSVVSTFFCFVLIYLFVKHDTKSGFLGLISAGLFAAFYNIVGRMDIAAVDALNLFILLSALFITRFYRNNKSYLAAGILLFLAFFTNQFSIILILFILGYGIIYNRRTILPVVITAVVLIAGSTMVMDKFYDNWFSYYTFELPLRQGISISGIILFWTEGLFRICMIPIGFIIYNLYSNFRSARKQSGWGFNLFAGVGIIVMAWFLQANTGIMGNALLPACGIIAILFGVSLNDILKRFKGKPDLNGSRLPDIIYLLVILQFAALIYNPARLIPSADDRSAGEKFVESVRTTGGEIFIPAHEYLAARAGKKLYAGEKAINDLLKDNDDEASSKLREQIKTAFADKEFTAVIYDDLYSPIRSFDTDKNYVFEKLMFADRGTFVTVTGAPMRPQYYFKLEHPPIEEFPLFEMIGPMPLPEEEQF